MEIFYFCLYNIIEKCKESPGRFEFIDLDGEEYGNENRTKENPDIY